MRKIVSLLMVGSTLALSGCYSQQDRTVGGAAVGAVAGGVLGGAISGTGTGAVIGAAGGAVTGAIIGANSPPPGGARCVRVRYDYYGNPVCVRYARYYY